MLLLLYLLAHSAESRCPFQNPFWFYDRPTAHNVYNDNGDMAANKIQVRWSGMENFKCVDYFQIEYFHKGDPTPTLDVTDRIDRNKRSVDIEVIPCTQYYFKVVAYEDWNGIREDFKVDSEVVRFTVKYAPKFKVPPRFKEKRRITFKPQPPPSYNQITSFGLTGPPISDIMEPSEELLFNIRWRLKDIDYPICLNHFELYYFDKDTNHTKFIRSIIQPFKRPKFYIQIESNEVSCQFSNNSLGLDFIFKIFGIHRKFTTTVWTPPSCIVTTTTPPPTTTTEEIPIEFNNTELFSLDNYNFSDFNSSVYYDDAMIDPDDLLTNILSDNKTATKRLWGSSNSIEGVGTDISTTESYIEEMKATRAQINSLKQAYENQGMQDFTALKDSFFQSMKDFLNQMKSEYAEEGSLLFGDGKIN